MNTSTSNDRDHLGSSLALFCCPQCPKGELAWLEPAAKQGRRAFQCQNCLALYGWEAGIFDFLGATKEVITPFQRLMQFPPITAIYESFWRPAGFFIASSSSFGKFSKTLLELVPRQQRLVLDLACGPGLFTLPLAERTAGRVVAFDLSLPMLRRAQRALIRRGIANVLLVRGSAFHLPFRPQTFDATLCSGALHLFDRADLALCEVSRTLQPEGAFVCQTTIKPKRSAGIATFLDRIIRFGFFTSTSAVSKEVGAAGLQINWQWHQRIIYLFRASKL
jgi:SAM-dependent methyltransferase